MGSSALKKYNNNSGFSLIEIMIVVTIIGILTSLAVPSFQVYVRRAKQGEAKGHLASIYQAQKAFHSEWGFFHGAFEHIGFQPKGELNYYYQTGAHSLAGNPAQIYTSVKGSAIPGANTNTVSYCGESYGQCQPNGATNVSTFTIAPASVSAAFNAAAAANFGSGLTNDEWRIDQDKELVQVSVGE